MIAQIPAHSNRICKAAFSFLDLLPVWMGLLLRFVGPPWLRPSACYDYGHFGRRNQASSVSSCPEKDRRCMLPSIVVYFRTLADGQSPSGRRKGKIGKSVVFSRLRRKRRSEGNPDAEKALGRKIIFDMNLYHFFVYHGKKH